MNAVELIRWQWEGYPRYHGARRNLFLHVFVVPIFLLGNTAIVVAAFQRSWALALGGAVVMVASIGIQGRGHRQEPTPPEPFTGPLNAVARIFCEQWVTFPRFVLSGGWLRALRQRRAA
jgi:hypothetical protein